MYPQQVNLMCLISEEKLNINWIFDIKFDLGKDKNHPDEGSRVIKKAILLPLDNP